MVKIKDKVIAVESLSTFHKYGKNNYLPMLNPAGKGTLTVDSISTNSIMFNNEVKLISRNNKLSLVQHIQYVSLGDSIAAGHTIDYEWEKNYGESSQYGVNGNTSTAIVSNSYTDLIRQDLTNTYGEDAVSVVSFARSGDTVADLIEKLSHDTVRAEIAKAKFVTICIGANDVLQPAMSHLDEYINTGDLSTIASVVESNLTILNDDTSSVSYMALFNKLAEINRDANYIFTTIYNPYKYLWLEEGRNGFFSPVLNTIPTMNIFGFSIDSLIKDGLLSTPIVQQLFDRVNRLSDWSENYVTRLNQVLKNKINSYKLINPNFKIADTKALYDTFPDRPITAPKHYNDLVSVEYTRGYDTMQMDWGRLYEDSGDAGTFWWNLATKYTSWSGLDINGFAKDLVSQMIEKVIVPDVDPHPEWYGHYALKRSFADVLGWSSLDRHTIIFNANGGSGSMSSIELVTLDGYTAYANLASNVFTNTNGYRFSSWNTAVNGSGTSYSNGQFIGINSDITLYAQWSNLYTLVYCHSQGDVIQFDSSQTGPMECYALAINGEEQSDLGAFSNSAITYSLPYGTTVAVAVAVSSGSDRSYVSLNGTTVSGKSNLAYYEFALTNDTKVEFEWNQWLSGLTMQSYWNCYITTY